MKHIILIVSAIFSSTLSVVFASPFPNVETITIESDLLEEKRTIHLSIPETYERDGSIPIVFVTDARSQFPMISSYLNNLAGNWPRLPDMVVVGIENTNRNRDFVPREDSRFAGTGGADTFKLFLRDELIPEIEERMGGASARILVGHSFGGVNAINVLLTDTAVFDAYIAIGTSTWVADRVLFERAEEAFSDSSPLNAWLYMAVAERDGGATVPDGEAFAALLEAGAPSTLNWHFEIIPKTDHFSAVPVGLDRAFSDLFPVWEQQAAVLDAGRNDPASVAAWFSAERARLEWRFQPHAWDMMIASYTLHAEGHKSSALFLLDETIKYHRSLPELYLAKGDFLIDVSAHAEAEKAWRTALTLLEADKAQQPRLAPVLARLEQLSDGGK